MSNYETFNESMITIVHENQLVGVIYHDPELRKQVIYSCKIMAGDDIAEMISGAKLQIGRSRKPRSKKYLEELADEGV